MLAISALLLTSVTAAAPTAKLPWFEFHDYPMRAFEKHQEGVTRFELLVDPNGRAANCTVTKSSGHEELDQKTCKLASFRSRFAPARGPDGRPVYGVYRSQAIWVFPENTLPNTAPGPDLQVSINKFPQGTFDPPVVKVAYFVDPQGRSSACGALHGERAQPQALVDLACRELPSKLQMAPARTAEGQPVPAVHTAAIEFVVTQASAQPAH
jgi:TonB family protein